MKIVKTWQPVWSTESKIESGGLYPLGLNSFHDTLESYLIQGIVFGANKLRYFTYSCWIIGDIEVNENCMNYAEFIEAFIKRENALALGLYLLKPKYSVAGSVSMSKIVKDNKEEYNCVFKLMKTKDLGAYEQNYAGSIYKWGLTYTDENGIKKLTATGSEIYRIHDNYLKQASSDYYISYKGKKMFLLLFY